MHWVNEQVTSFPSLSALLPFFLDLTFTSDYPKLDSCSYLTPVRMITDGGPCASALLAYTRISLILLELGTTKLLFDHTRHIGCRGLWWWQFAPRKGMRNKAEKRLSLQRQLPSLWDTEVKRGEQPASSHVHVGFWIFPAKMTAPHVVLGYNTFPHFCEDSFIKTFFFIVDIEMINSHYEILIIIKMYKDEN